MVISYRIGHGVSNRSFLSIRRPAINRTDRTLCAGAHNGEEGRGGEPLKEGGGWMVGEMVLAVDSCSAIARCEPVPTRERIALSLSPAGIHGLDLTWPNVMWCQYQAVASHAPPSQPRLCNRHAISSSPRPRSADSGARQAAGLAVVGRHPMPGQDRHFNSAPYPPIYKPLPSIFSPPCQSKPQLLAS